MLLAGTPASTIARDLGFSDQSHFIRSFRKQFGVTPGDFQSARQPGTRPAAAAVCA
jgi:AraC-like DNA-binding protein